MKIKGLLLLFGLLSLFLVACNRPYIVTIKFDTNGGEKIEDLQGEAGTRLTLPVPTYDDYEFLGWYRDYQFEKKFEDGIFPEHNITLIAKWDIPVRKVSIMNYDYSIIQTLEVESFDISKIEKPKLDGYNFTDWFIDEELSVKYSEEVVEGLDSFSLYPGYEPSDSNSVFVSPTGKKQNKGGNFNPITLDAALDNQIKNIYLLPGKYELNSTIILNYEIKLSGIGEVIIDANTSNYGLYVNINNSLIENISVTNATNCGIIVEGSNNEFKQVKSFGNKGNGITITLNEGKTKPENNHFLLCESYENSSILNDALTGNGFYISDSSGDGNYFDGCMAYNNSSAGFYFSNAKNHSSLSAIINSVSFENNKGIIAGENYNYANLRIKNAIIFENNIGIESNAYGGITLNDLTFYNNSCNILMKNNKFTKMENILSYNQKKSNDIYGGYIANSIILGNGKYYQYNNYTLRLDEYSYINSKVDINIFESITFTNSIKNNELVCSNFLVNKYNMGANLSKGNYFHLSENNDDSYIWILDLTNLINGTYIKTTLSSTNITYEGQAIVSLNEEEQKLFASDYVKYSPQSEGENITIKIADKEYSIIIKTISFPNKYEIMDWNVTENVYLNGVYTFINPKLRNVYTNMIYTDDEYSLVKKLYFKANNEDDYQPVEEINTLKLGVYQIEVTITIAGDVITYIQTVNILEFNQSYITTVANLTYDGKIEINVSFPIGEVYGLVVEGESSKPTKEEVLENENYSGEIIYAFKENFTSLPVYITNCPYNQNYKYYYVIKCGSFTSDVYNINVTEPVVVSNKTDLQEAINLNSKYIVLGNDIDCNGITTSFSYFSGTLDGNNFKLTNLSIVNGGLFTTLDGALIYDLIIENSTVSASDKGVGILADKAINTRVDNLQIINSTSKSNDVAAGLIGELYGKNSITNVRIEGKNTNIESVNVAAGLIGIVNDLADVTIDNCTISTNIKSSYTTAGLIGQINADWTINIIVKNVNIKSNIMSVRNSFGVFGDTNVIYNNLNLVLNNIYIDSLFSGYSQAFINSNYILKYNLNYDGLLIDKNCQINDLQIFIRSEQ